MTCSSCAGYIESVVKEQPGVLSIEVDILNKYLIIKPKYNETVNIATLKIACDEVGHELLSIDQETETKILAAKIRSDCYKVLLTGIAGFSLFALCTSGLVMPVLAMYFAAAISTLILLYVGYDIYRQAFNKIRALQPLDMNTLFAVSTLSLLLISIISLCMPMLGLPLFFDAALMIFFFFYLGRIIKAYTSKVISPSSLCELAAKESILIPNYSEEIIDEKSFKQEAISTKELMIGQTILIKKNGVIPVDCTVIRAIDAEVFDHMVAGKLLTELEKGQKLLAGTKVTEGSVYLQVIAYYYDGEG